MIPTLLAPGSLLGLVGGGQLGRMFAMAAQTLGFRVLVLDPDEGSPAGAVCDEKLVAAYGDARALGELARRVAAVTTEFENVPADALELLARSVLVTPAARSVAIAQDRIAEKAFIEGTGAQVAPHRVIRELADIDSTPDQLFPGVLKASRLGYDGKGQVRVGQRSDARQGFVALGSVPCILEQRLALDFEISVVIARSQDGAVVTFPVSENLHRDGILHVTRVPSPRVDGALAARAAAEGTRIAHALEYQGVLCVEFFVLADGSMVVNEIAPRPHNSGHYSIDACYVSQFDAQVRVMTGAPLVEIRQHSAAVMLNVLGDLWWPADATAPREPNWCAVLSRPHARLHLYGKHTARLGRKMGHITLLGQDSQALWEDARELASVLGMPAF